MARTPTYPDIAEDLPYISIKDLKDQGLFNLGINSLGVFRLCIDGMPRGGTIEAFVGLKDIKYISLSWYSEDKYFTASTKITSIKSNLGAGEIYYFLCPKTSKRCLKLYFLGNVLASRRYFNLYYRDQILSKPNYGIIQLCKAFQEFDELKNKYWSLRTKSYKGVPTRQAIRLRVKMENKRRIIQAIQKVTEKDYQKEIQRIKKGI
ncbi:hypothetical protein [Cecembia rubra]|uniref:Uncharacterized protein n=1 Tax=Cecembia rubra TaxID=1485585 RepID=A0A2P8E330_9BACT|nr:hypothetical protein [Cecembia rubra]PSL03882.1 hypothetical protein CLV48_106122 [Cecembia rubra]